MSFVSRNQKYPSKQTLIDRQKGMENRGQIWDRSKEDFCKKVRFGARYIGR
jgi:hypothetical protein